MISIGIICYQGHSSSATLVVDGKIIGAAAEERFTRIKSDDAFPAQSIKYLLETHYLKIQEIDEINIAWSWKKTFLYHLKNIGKFNLSFIFEKRKAAHNRSRLEKFFKIFLLQFEIRWKFLYFKKINYLDHHACHAFTALAFSQLENAIIFIADGMGEFESTTILEKNDLGFKVLYRDIFPHSLGVFYSAGTQLLGFAADSDEFKVMGLKAYGQNSEYVKKLQQLFFISENHFKLNLDYFDIHQKANQFYSQKFLELVGNLDSFEKKANFAFALQTTLEEIVLCLLKQNIKNSSEKNFISSGGVFLNCLLNQKIREEKIFKNCVFNPIPDDFGTSLGAACFHQQKTFCEHLFLGPSIFFEEKFLPKNCDYSHNITPREIAKILADGHVVALAQGAMEFGHRSLGHRSILADPRSSEMKERVNKKIKWREEFRPFAPSILIEHLHDYFIADKDLKFPYMIETAIARDNTRLLAPAIVHNDGTSRLHTVDKADNAFFYEILSEFFKLTECPILLNTSFNLNAMPIVNNCQDAISCFIQTDLDFLVVDRTLIWK